MEIKCPFCDEDDFDLIGLKYHLIHHCDVYDSIDMSSIISIFNIGEYDIGTGGIKRMACNCVEHKTGELTGGWICPVHGQRF